MTKKLLLPGIFIFIFLACGCTVAKSAGGACAGFAQGAAVGASEGFKDDVSFVKKADNWVKDNLW